MRKWFSFEIGGVGYTAYIAKRSEFDAEEKLDGLADPSARRVYIADDLAVGANAQSACEGMFFHELNHVINGESGASAQSFGGRYEREELHVNMTSPMHYAFVKSYGFKLPRVPKVKR